MNTYIWMRQIGLIMAVIPALFLAACKSGEQEDKSVRRVGVIEGEFVAFFEHNAKSQDPIESLKQQFPNAILASERLLINKLPQDRQSEMLWLRIDCQRLACEREKLSRELGHALAPLGLRRWRLSPNYEYAGRALESPVERPNDPEFDRQYHHQLLETQAAWQMTEGSPEIIVAVTDNGFDYEHEDLVDSFWRNAGEQGLDSEGRDRSSNGIDDDGNGYIDDALGWDFTKGGDNDPAPESLFPGVVDSHGTHIAGIIAANKDNHLGVAGVAPAVKVMPLRFSGSGTWSSITVARSYAYAVRHGAKIINTSYSIDAYEDDPVYRITLEQVYARDVLIINSAGNNGRANPPRQNFEELILVANTYADPKRMDQKNPNSNYGQGIDLAAPGDILSTVPGNAYRVKTGTSMSAPIAAAVAALIWSEHPDWSRDQVAAQLIGSSDNIEAMNPDFKYMLGDGRVNARRALTEPIPAVALTPLTKRVQQGNRQLSIRTRGRLDPQSLHLGSIVAEGPLTANEDLAQTWDLQSKTPYKMGSNELILELPSELPLGRYRLVVKDLRDPFGGLPEFVEGEQYFTLVPFDQSPPELLAIKSPEQVAREQGSFTLRLIGKDNLTGIVEAQLRLRHQSTAAFLVASVTQSQPTSELTLQFNFDQNQDSGRYRFESLTLIDWDGNRRNYQNEDENLPLALQSLSIQLNPPSGIDDLGPELISISAPDLVRMGSQIPLRLNALDQSSGISKIYYEWRGKNTFLSFRGEVNLSAGTMWAQESVQVVSVDSPVSDDPDVFYLAALTLVDQVGNRSSFRAGPTSPYFYDTRIEVPVFYAVRELDDDRTPPLTIDLQLTQNHFMLGDSGKLVAKILDEQSEIADAKAYFRRGLSIIISDEIKPLGDDRYELSFASRDYHELGEYVLYKFETKDALGNLERITIGSDDDLYFSGTELEAPRFHLHGRDNIDFQPPAIDLESIRGGQSAERLWIDLRIEDQSAIDYIDLSIVSQDEKHALWSVSGFEQRTANVFRIYLTSAEQAYNTSAEETFLLHTLVAADQFGNTSLLEADFEKQCFDRCSQPIPQVLFTKE